jgi:hypothetical protein
VEGEEMTAKITFTVSLQRNLSGLWNQMNPQRAILDAYAATISLADVAPRNKSQLTKAESNAADRDGEEHEGSVINRVIVTGTSATVIIIRGCLRVAGSKGHNVQAGNQETTEGLDATRWVVMVNVKLPDKFEQFV